MATAGNTESTTLVDKQEGCPVVVRWMRTEDQRDAALLPTFWRVRQRGELFFKLLRQFEDGCRVGYVGIVGRALQGPPVGRDKRERSIGALRFLDPLAAGTGWSLGVD